MQFRIVSRQRRGLSTMLLGLVAAMLWHDGDLRAARPGGSVVDPASALPAALGVSFVEGSRSTLILERDGKQYLVDLNTRTISESDAPVQVALVSPQQDPPAAAATSDSGAAIFETECASCHGADGTGISAAGTPDLTDFRSRAGIPSQQIIDVITNGRSGTAMQAFSDRLTAAEIGAVASYVQSLAGQTDRPDIYEPADDFVYSLPTGRPLPSKGLYVNFTHRFAYDPAFSGSGLGNTLLGLDGFSVSSFGFRFGLTDKLSVSAYRAPSLIGRPIELMAAYNFLDEHDGHPLNASVRVSVDGQDNFRRNFTTNFEGIVSRSISGRAQIYAVPTLSLDNRRLLSKPGALANRPADLPGIDSFSLGVGLAVNIRPSVALVAEVIPTLVHGRELGIHRPAYAFGIQKQVAGHAFTLGFSNGPGTVVAQRAGTRATFLGDPAADKPSGLFLGFNLMRRLH